MVSCGLDLGTESVRETGATTVRDKGSSSGSVSQSRNQAPKIRKDSNVSALRSLFEE